MSNPMTQLIIAADSMINDYYLLKKSLIKHSGCQK